MNTMPLVAALSVVGFFAGAFGMAMSLFNDRRIKKLWSRVMPRDEQ